MNRILLEDGYALLLEDGGYLLAELSTPKIVTLNPAPLVNISVFFPSRAQKGVPELNWSSSPSAGGEQFDTVDSPFSSVYTPVQTPTFTAV